MKTLASCIATLISALAVIGQSRPLPVIDMHLHALHANDQGPAPISVGAPFRDLGTTTPKTILEKSSCKL